MFIELKEFGQDSEVKGALLFNFRTDYKMSEVKDVSVSFKMNPPRTHAVLTYPVKLTKEEVGVFMNTAMKYINATLEMKSDVELLH